MINLCPVPSFKLLFKDISYFMVKPCLTMCYMLLWQYLCMSKSYDMI